MHGVSNLNDGTSLHLQETNIIFFRSCYFPTIFVPLTYNALSLDDKNGLGYIQLKVFRTSSGKKTYDDRYDQALEFIYQTEENGGFPEQKR